jgi:DNA-binding XRE family transcriptional regulator
MAGGRPTLYDPSYCQIAIDFMAQGYSQTALAGHLSISKDTLYEWMKVHPEFSDAIKIARPKRVMALEIGMLNTESSAVVNARKFALINADKEEWRLPQTMERPQDVEAESKELDFKKPE